MLFYLGFSEGFWGETMLTACYILDRVPTRGKKTILYKLWYKIKASLDYLRVWGHRAIVRVSVIKGRNFMKEVLIVSSLAMHIIVMLIGFM